MFKNRSAELGEPKISLFVAKLDNPTLSFGVRKNIIMINKILTTNPIQRAKTLIYTTKSTTNATFKSKNVYQHNI